VGLNDILDLACSCRLKEAQKAVQSAERRSNDNAYMAGLFHIQSAFSLLFASDPATAVNLHKEAKRYHPTTVPPLAKLHLDGKHCGGLGDLFYISAVIIKQLVDAPTTDAYAQLWAKAVPTLISLTMDSGLSIEGERHMHSALALPADRAASGTDTGTDMELPTDTSYPDAAVRVRSLLMTPVVYFSQAHVNETRTLLEERVAHALTLPAKQLLLQGLNEFSLTPTFYLVYQGRNDRDFLLDIHKVYGVAYPSLQAAEIAPASPADIASVDTPNVHATPTRVGFVSAHFRRHSICKLFCGVIAELAAVAAPTATGKAFSVHVFSGVKELEEDAYTRALREAVGSANYVTAGMTLIQNRYLVTERAIDVLVFLDVGMDPATNAWAGARLAPVQVVTWGHPSTTGLPSLDYFVSAEAFHADKWGGGGVAASGSEPSAVTADGAYSYFAEQLVLLPSLNFFFQRAEVPRTLTSSQATSAGEPSIHVVMQSREGIRSWATQLVQEFPSTPLETLTAAKQSGFSLILCPQHLPKFHPRFDAVLEAILRQAPRSKLVLIHRPEKQMMWRVVLEQRWAAPANGTPLLGTATTQARIIWLPRLTADEYLTMLAIGDVMIDPAPFGGGVTSLEALSMCVPVVTAPRSQTVPGLSAGIIRALHVSDTIKDSLVAPSVSAFIASVVRLLTDPAALHLTEEAICGAYHRHSSNDTNVWQMAFGSVKTHTAAGYDVGGVFNQRRSVEDWAYFLTRVHSASTP